jgi:serine protease Do
LADHDHHAVGASASVDVRNYYQISVPVQPGNSGGPLVGMDSGWAVGVITLRLDHTPDGRSVENVSYAIKCSMVQGFLADCPDAVTDIRARTPVPPDDPDGVINRVKESAVQILVPH